jgi:hypothetical protein
MKAILGMGLAERFQALIQRNWRSAAKAGLRVDASSFHSARLILFKFFLPFRLQRATILSTKIRS